MDNLYRSTYRLHSETRRLALSHVSSSTRFIYSWVPKGDAPPLMTDPPTPEQLKLTEGMFGIAPASAAYTDRPFHLRSRSDEIFKEDEPIRDGKGSSSQVGKGSQDRIDIQN